MATQKPISTISYNSESFLIEKLQILYDAHIIQAWQYIVHKGEDGDKDHIHLRIEPNKRIDAMDLTEKFKEFEKGNDKPLGVRPWRNSKEEDWYLYSVHDSDYLSLKYGGGDRGEKLPYDWKDIKTSPDYDLETAWIRAKAAQKHSTVNIATSIQNGVDPVDLLKQGENPYIILNVMRLLSGNDYSRLASDYRELNTQYQILMDKHESLVDAFNRDGLIVSFDDNGKVIISSGVKTSGCDGIFDSTPLSFNLEE